MNVFIIPNKVKILFIINKLGETFCLISLINILNFTSRETDSGGNDSHLQTFNVKFLYQNKINK